MNALAFLGIVIVVSALGSLVVWLRHRSPTTLESGIEAFQREMEALAPPGDDEPSDRRGRGR